jgi:tetrahydromethanopterin S-methyltransferase subunit A
MSNADRERAITVAAEHLRKALGAGKCHPCGCLHGTLSTLDKTTLGRGALAGLLDEVRGAITPKAYDCLGCAVCDPAVASNALGHAFPELAGELLTCSTDPPAGRRGWPPLPGDYHIVRYGAPVAVCVLTSETLAARVAAVAPDGLAIVGPLHTENLGIERIIRNVLANPNIRFLLICGEDTRQAIGHLPGQSLVSLFANGLDEDGRIRGARGKRPLLKNVTAQEIEAFRHQVESIPFIGEEHEETILHGVAEADARNPGPWAGTPTAVTVDVVQAREPDRMVMDPSGFFVVHRDGPRRRLMLEHYTREGTLDCLIEGTTATAVSGEAIQRQLLTRLDHAAYLGRELARAERSLQTGEPYVQDRAPGHPPFQDPPDAPAIQRTPRRRNRSRATDSA